jgi:hypothetical protein
MFLLLVPLCGLYVFGGLYLIFKCATAIGRMFNSFVARVVVVIFLSSVLYGDEVITYLAWRYDCAYKAGDFVYAHQSAPGFLYSGLNGLSKAGAREFLDRGYSYVEGQLSSSTESEKVENFRFKKSENGKVVGEAVNGFESEFEYVKSIEIGFPHVYLMRARIYKVATNETMGESLSFNYSGGEVLRIFKSLVGADKEGSAEVCYGRSSVRSLIQETIPPTH